MSWEQDEPGRSLTTPELFSYVSQSNPFLPLPESRGLTNSREAANHAAQERKALEMTLPLNAKPFGNNLFCTNTEHYDYL